ncbi:MAG: hypothetical protein QOG90_2143, partial [Actinomycetota bacterium]
AASAARAARYGWDTVAAETLDVARDAMEQAATLLQTR